MSLPVHITKLPPMMAEKGHRCFVLDLMTRWCDPMDRCD